MDITETVLLHTRSISQLHSVFKYDRYPTVFSTIFKFLYTGVLRKLNLFQNLNNCNTEKYAA